VRWYLFLLLLLPGRALTQNVFPPIGLWREHLPYQAAADVTASATKVYTATPYSLFSYDLQGNEISRISKVAGLSETGISVIRFDALSKKLYIAYNNSNIDVLDEGGIHNIPDIKRENIAGDKNIYHIYTDNATCYLSTGLGVIVLDGNKMEVKDSWFIGNTGNYVRTNGFTRTANNFYAATEEGLKKIPSVNTDPADFHNWQLVSGSGGLPALAAKGVVNFQNRIVAWENDSLYSENGTSWNLFFGNGWQIRNINVSGNKLFVSQTLPNGASQVAVLNPDGSLNHILQQPGIISFPKNAIEAAGSEWVADLYGGLSKWNGGSHELFTVNSPTDISLGGLAIAHNVLYAAAGSVNSAWNYQYNRGGISRLADDQWTNYNRFTIPRLDSMLDFVALAVDPLDGTLWAGSFGGGLLHIRENGQVQIYKQSSPLGAPSGDPTSYRVAGLAFDSEGNLWVSNFGSGRQLHVLRRDGSWRSYTAPLTLNENAVSQVLLDQAEQKWIVSPLGNGLLVFDDNHTPDNFNDDKWRMYRAGAGLGNLPSNDVFCLALDKSGFVWVGTSDGIGVIQCPEQAFATGCEGVLPVIKEGGFANYLFKGQEVRSIAVDGADRKWVATSAGVWLISPDGDKVISRFTEENSPLLSNDVKTIAINGETGEVFFATANGISSFRGTATEAEETKDKALVFPNPVPPGFTGSIGIRGLPENAYVKITELSGRLVYQTRSNGGQATWNGKDYRGQQAASGVYLVMATDENKEEKMVARIVLIGK
jgi:hypothetical protein